MRTRANGPSLWFSPANASSLRSMQRLDVIKVIGSLVTKEDVLTTSIGGTWDDWWNHKPANNTFFMSILGSVVPTALGLALSLPHRRVIALETDGSALM